MEHIQYPFHLLLVLIPFLPFIVSGGKDDDDDVTTSYFFVAYSISDEEKAF